MRLEKLWKKKCLNNPDMGGLALKNAKIEKNVFRAQNVKIETGSYFISFLTFQGASIGVKNVCYLACVKSRFFENPIFKPVFER